MLQFIFSPCVYSEDEGEQPIEVASHSFVVAASCLRAVARGGCRRVL